MEAASGRTSWGRFFFSNGWPLSAPQQGSTASPLSDKLINQPHTRPSNQKESGASSRLTAQSAAVGLHSRRFAWNYLLEEFWFDGDVAREGRAISSDQR
jgi:hypothetical protein